MRYFWLVLWFVEWSILKLTPYWAVDQATRMRRLIMQTSYLKKHTEQLYAELLQARPDDKELRCERDEIVASLTKVNSIGKDKLHFLE